MLRIQAMRVTRVRAADLAGLVVGALLLQPAVARADALGDMGEQMRVALEGGSLGIALLTAFGAGVLTSFTPCVYPMIAITVSVFGARQAKSRREGALLSTAFVGGMVALFTPLGIASAMTGMAFGSWIANPIVISLFVLLFLAMALSMFGAFDLTLPARLQNRLAQVGGMGYRGAFLLGLVTGLIAAPCTGPVVAVLLAWVAATGDVVVGGSSFALYALGLGLLFWVVGTFAVSLPKSGRWLEGVKGAFGVLMLALAAYFALPLLDLGLPHQRTPAWLGLTLGALVVGLALGAVHLSFHSPSRAVRARKALGIGFAVFGIVGAVAWTEALPAGAQITWLDDYQHAQRISQANARPMLVDFGADWCKACKEIEHGALSDPRVIAEAERFVPVRIDLSTGKDTPDKWALLGAYEQPGLPLVVLHHSDGREAARVTGPVNATHFLDLMRQAE
jgi:thioredoxin:protein disulfide reductase